MLDVVAIDIYIEFYSYLTFFSLYHKAPEHQVDSSH